MSSVQNFFPTNSFGNYYSNSGSKSQSTQPSYNFFKNKSVATDSTNFQHSFVPKYSSSAMVGGFDTSATTTSATNTTGTTNNASAMGQMVMSMLSMMLQMMTTMMNGSTNSGTDTGTGTTVGKSLDTATDSDITKAQNSIASEFVPLGTAASTANETLVNKIAKLDPNSTDSVNAQLELANANKTANPQHVQEYMIFQALRASNATLDDLNDKTGFSTSKAQATADRTKLIASLKTLENRPLSTEELQATPLPDSIKTALLPNTLTASQIMDINAVNDQDSSYTPPGGVDFSGATAQAPFTRLQNQYLFYKGTSTAA